MKNKLFLAAFLLLVFCDGYSQPNKNKGYLYLSAGPSFPVGSFAKKDVASKTSGLAKTGEAIAVSYCRPISKHFGFAAAVHGQRNGLNKTALENFYSQAKIYNGFYFASSPYTPPPASFPYTIYPNWKFKKGSWLLGSLLAGGYTEFPITASPVSVTGKAMVGGVYASLPRVEGGSITDTATAQTTQSNSKGFGFAYSLSGGIKYGLTSKLSLLANAEYIGANKIVFKKVKSTLNTTKSFPLPAVTLSSVTQTGNQKIEAMNVSLGIGIRL